MKKVKKSFKITKNSNEKILSVKISTLTKYEILKIVSCRIKQNKQTVIMATNESFVVQEKDESILKTAGLDADRIVAKLI